LFGWSIRNATDADLRSVLDLWAGAGGPPSVSDTPEALSLLLETDPGSLLVAESDGILIGSLIAAWDGWRGCFYRLAVDAGRRREGIAAALLREGERRLRERGAVRLTAIVADEDTAAMSFWETAGYERQRDRTRFVRPARG
jgi:ribosomal protein S18 acetylase RimI-like enzyme